MLDTLSHDDHLALIAALSSTWLWELVDTPGQAAAYRALLARVIRARTVVLNHEVNPVVEQ